MLILNEGRAVWQGSGPSLLQSKYMAHLNTQSAIQETAKPNDSLPTAEKVALGTLENSADSTIKMNSAHGKTPKQVLLDESKGNGDLNSAHWRGLVHIMGTPFWWAVVAVLIGTSSLIPLASRKFLE